MQKNIPLLPTITDSEMTPLVILLLKYIEEQGKYFEGEVGKLKDQIARLEKNSSNSSKPPSSDITTRKEEQRQPGKRKIGGQRGHNLMISLDL